jgi:hypothetical protein
MPVSGLQHAPALGGEGKAGPAALAQFDAQPFFQIRHLHADGGPADAQRYLGGGKAAAGRHGAEHAQ